MTDSRRNQISRRDFIKATIITIGGTIGALIGIPVIGYLISPSLRESVDNSWVNLGALESYPLNVPTLFQFTRVSVNGWERTGTSYGVFVLRQEAVGVRVFSNVCTHLACHVNWHPDAQQYLCPCHDGHFDILGRNIGGPPPRPLDEFETKIEEGNVMILLPPFERTA